MSTAIIDFSRVAVGTLVKRSAHWHKERCTRPGSYERRQFGILVGKSFVDEGKGIGITCYPIIHWEGAASSSTTHPLNVRLFRPNGRLT
jgi:hypothetical protein